MRRDARLERFGAIVQLACRARWCSSIARWRARGARVDRRAAIWRGDRDRARRAPLSAPLEAHLQLTNRCDAGCQGCYTGASPDGAPRRVGARRVEARDRRARRGRRVPRRARRRRERGAAVARRARGARAARAASCPNLTTRASMASTRCSRSPIASARSTSRSTGSARPTPRVRGFDGFARADAAIRALRAVQARGRHQRRRHARTTSTSSTRSSRTPPSAGSRRSSCCASSRRAAARARTTSCAAPTRSTARSCRRSSPPRGATRARQGRLLVHADARASRAGSRAARRARGYGCTGGDFLVGAKPDGRLTACSFAAPPPPAGDAGRGRPSSRATGRARCVRRVPHAGATRAEPCASCRYHALCRGGCKVVSAHVTGDRGAPDPECPRVVDLACAAARAPARAIGSAWKATIRTAAAATAGAVPALRQRPREPTASMRLACRARLR